MNDLVFLKLGGSLITDKTQSYSFRPGKVRELAQEIKSGLSDLPHLGLVLGHGSGSFGHFAVQENLDALAPSASTTGRPRSDLAYWRGFAEVWFRASQLNRLLVEGLHDAGIPVISLPPSSSLGSSDGQIVSWETGPIRAALDAGVTPLIFGDIVFDRVLGARVISTEVLMWHLAKELRPSRILLAGLEEAVWADFPHRRTAISSITPSTIAAMTARIGGSSAPDVTGGMKSKVEEMLKLAQSMPGLHVQIFSGEIAGNLRRVLAGETLGTMISSD